jgi:hypothetical protein
MPINPATVKSFLDRSWAPLRDFKAMDESEVLAWIERATGRPLAPKTKPRLYQLHGIAAGLDTQGCIFNYDMQLGKTKMALDTAQHLRDCGEWKGQGLILAHSPIGMEVWRNQIEQHSRLTAAICGTNPEDFIKAFESGVDFIIMTWSSMQYVYCDKRPNRKNILTLYANKDKLSEAAECFDLAIVDECHKLGNPYSLWFDMAVKITQNCNKVFGLTGTLVNRDPFSLWSQLYMIDRGERLGYNFQFCQEAFGKKVRNYAAGIDQKVFDKAKMPILTERLASCVISYTREEAGQMIALERGIIKLKMQGEQLQAYQNCLNEIIRTDTEVIDTDASFTRLRQISSGYLPFKDSGENKRVLRFINDVKFAYLEDFLKEMPADFPILIFHEFIRTGELLTRMLTRLKISHSWMYGGTTPAQDRQAVEDFQAGKTQVFVANSASGGTSITLNRADYVLFFETPAAPIIRAQAEARPNAERNGRPLFVDDIVCSPTENRILGFIEEGRDLAHELRTGKNRRELWKSLKA